VIAETIKRSSLAQYADRFAAVEADHQGTLRIQEVPFLTQFNLRADASDQRLMAEFHRALGFPLPLEPNTVSLAGERRALWLAPDEWLVVAPEGQQDGILQSLRSGLGGDAGSLVDVSANRTVLEINGRSARDLLTHGCPIDLERRSFESGRCAQTLLAKAQVILERGEGHDETFRVYVRSSFASYLADWLLDAAPDASPVPSGGAQKTTSTSSSSM
jgi:sarcosine oxidase, subunit gamma